MNNQGKPVVDMNWLAEGGEDQFANYLERAREDLSMADFSDDELANYAFMNYDRTPEAEAAEMISRHRNGMLDQFHSRIAIMTAVKERLRWLSRQVAVLEGRYPGVSSPAIPTARFSSVEEAKVHLEKSEGYAHPPHDQHSAYYDRPEYGSCFSVGGELTIDDMKAIIFIHEQENGTETDQLRVIENSIIPKPMPDLSVINAEGEHTVNPEWEKWYEDTYGTDTGSGYIAGKAIIRQVSINNGRALGGVIGRVHGSGDTYSFVNEPGLAILRRNLEVGVETMEGVQRILDNGYAEGINELKALGGTQDPKSFLEKASEQYLEDFANRQIERLAKELYDTWSCKDDWVPWTERGNSNMQVLAREMVIKRLEEEGKQLLVGSSANFALRQKNYRSPKTAEESQWYKEMEEFLMELEPEYKLSGQVSLNKVIDTLITKSTVDWETFCKGFSFNPVDAKPLSISYELRLMNLAEFREQWNAGKFKPVEK